MAMNDAEVERQIDQMVRFIKQEAQEKANEIAVSAEEVHAIPAQIMHGAVCARSTCTSHIVRPRPSFDARC